MTPTASPQKRRNRPAPKMPKWNLKGVYAGLTPQFVTAAIVYYLNKGDCGRFRDSMDYFLIIGMANLPSKLIIGVAIAFRDWPGTGSLVPWLPDPNDINGGREVQAIFRQLGYTVVQADRYNAHKLRPTCKEM